MASNIRTTLVHLVGRAAEKYLLMAILAGIIAGISYYLNLGAVVTDTALVGAAIAGASAASAQFVSTGSIPGTQIPIATLLQLGFGALIAVSTKLLAVTQWTTPAILSAVVLFLGTLLSEVQAQPTPAPTPSAGTTTGGTP